MNSAPNGAVFLPKMWYNQAMNMVRLLVAERDKLQELFDIETKKETEAANEKLRLQGKHQLLTQLIDQLDKPKKEDK